MFILTLWVIYRGTDDPNVLLLETQKGKMLFSFEFLKEIGALVEALEILDSDNKNYGKNKVHDWMKAIFETQHDEVIKLRRLIRDNGLFPKNRYDYMR